MSEELLRIDRLPTISEFSFLLLEILDRDSPIHHYELDAICKSCSLNFALAFENSLKFLAEISIIKIHKDESVSRSIDKLDLNELKWEY
jgi:hypothetical protein